MKLMIIPDQWKKTQSMRAWPVEELLKWLWTVQIKAEFGSE